MRIKQGLVGAAVAIAVLAAAFGLRSLRRKHPSVGTPDAAVAGAPRDAGEPDDSTDAGPAPRLLVEGVVRMGGRVVPGAQVMLGGPGGVREALSGPDGVFAFLGVPEGRFALRVTRDSDTAYVPEVTGVEMGAGRVLAVELQRGVRVAGHIKDRGGKPISGSEAVLLEDAGAPLPRKALAGFDGGFHFDAVLPGRYQVAARADGFLPPQPQVVSAPGTIELRLERAACVDGRVVDERSKPVSGAVLEVSGEGAGGVPIAVTAAAAAGEASGRLDAAGELGVLRGPIPFPPRVVSEPAAAASESARGFLTDARGGFKVCGVPPGRVVIAATHPEFLRAASDPFVLGSGSTVTTQLVLRRGASGGGLVLDDRGAGLGGARVSVSSAQQTARLAVTDATGRFRIDGLGDGPYHVEIEHPDFPRLSRKGVELDGDTRFELALGGGIEGDLRDSRTGQQPAGARLILRHGADERPLPLARGRFSAYGLRAGAATLSASAPGYVSWKREVTIPAATRPREITLPDVRIELERGGIIEGQLRDDRGDPVPNAAISAGSSTARTDERGEFTLDGVASGRATVEAVAGARSTKTEVDVRSAERTRADLRF